MILSNIRLLEDVEPYAQGECIKAYIQRDGKAEPWSGGGLLLYPEEYELVVSNSQFDKLLAGISPHSDKV